MKSGLIYLMTLAVFIFATSAGAGTQTISLITSTMDKEKILLQLLTDSNEDITHLKLVYKNEKGKVYDTDKYKAAVAARGINLYEVDKRNVVDLRSHNFSRHQGGNIELDFLVNGITGKRRQKEFNLTRDADKWSIEFSNQKVKELRFITSKFLGKTIGIKEIKVK